MLAHLFRRPLCHHQTAAAPSFRSEVDQPVGTADHVQVVLDDDQRMTRLQQLAQGPHQLGDVVEVQAGGRFVKQEQGAFPGQRLATGGGALGGLGQETRQLQSLGLPARERRHGLPQAHVLQTHIHNGLEGTDHLPVGPEELRGFAHRQLQHIGHIEHAPATLDAHLQHLGPVALAVAVRAAQVNVAEELHLHMLEA